MVKFISGVLIVLFSFMGCSVKKVPPIDLYTLSVPDVAAERTTTCTTKTLKVLTPFSAYEYTTNQLYFVIDDLEEGTYQNSKWSRSIAESIYDGVIRTVRKSGYFKSVENYTSVARSDYDLEIEISDFKQYFSKDKNSSHVILDVTFTLVERKNYIPVAQKHIHITVPATTPDAKGGVVAFNKANKKMLDALLAWLGGACQ
jgi:cholesterol transport system auxiliary component